MVEARKVRVWVFVGGFILLLLLSSVALVLTSGGWKLVLLLIAGGLFSLILSFFVLAKGLNSRLSERREVIVDATLLGKILLVLLGALLLNSADCGDFECPREVGTLFIQRMFDLPQFPLLIQSILILAGILLIIAFAGLMIRMARRTFEVRSL